MAAGAGHNRSVSYPGSQDPVDIIEVGMPFMPILPPRSALGNISRLTQSGLAVLVRPRARQITARFLFLDVVMGSVLWCLA